MRKRSLLSILLLIGVATVVPSTQEPARYDLAISARLEYKTGPDAIPPNKVYITVVSGVSFYLFDADPGELLENAGVTLLRDESHGESHRAALLSEYLAALRVLDDKHGGSNHLREFHTKASPLLKPHLVQTTVTDGDGRAVFKSVATGSYYLAGAANPPSAREWNIKVTVPGPPIMLR